MMNNNTEKIKASGIKSWPEDDRPREKLLKKGAKALSNSELLAILLRTGTNGTTAIDLARKVLKKFNTFRNMAHTDSRDWSEFKGMWYRGACPGYILWGNVGRRNTSKTEAILCYLKDI